MLSSDVKQDKGGVQSGRLSTGALPGLPEDPRGAKRGLPGAWGLLKASRAVSGGFPNSAEPHVGKRRYTE